MAPLSRASAAVWPAIVLSALAAFILTQYFYARHVPFINEDYVFLDETRDAPFGALWTPRTLVSHWYRPVSRELHYWALQKLAGARELPFHLASFGLWLAVMGLYAALVRRLAGAPAAAIATAGAAAMAAWAVPLVWIAGVQDLWMLVWALVCLTLAFRERFVWAAAAFVLALLSKESAVVLPGIVLAHDRWMKDRRWIDSLRRIAPMIAIAAVWGFLHPMLGGRLWGSAAAPASDAGQLLGERALRTFGVVVNLDEWPRPEVGWAGVLVVGLIGAAILALLIALGSAASSRVPGVRPRLAHALGFGGAWAACGWLPLLMPALGWHAYYAIFGALGVWFVLGVLMAHRTRWAIVVVALLALLRAGRAETPSHDWGSEWYQRRAGSFLYQMRADLQRLLPTLAPHSRLFFVRVPSKVGFLTGDAPVLRVWYGDSTVTGGFYPSYRPRSATAPDGPDYFFRYDSLLSWVPIRRGEEDLEAARRSNPRWEHDHEVLAKTLAEAGDWSGAAVEYMKLAAAVPYRVDHAYNAGVSHEALGDSAAAAIWFARAAALPGADAEVRASALRLQSHLREAPTPRAPSGGSRNP
jgi:hypothetical protein